MLQWNPIFHHNGFAASDAATADEVHALGIFAVHIDFAIADAPLCNYGTVGGIIITFYKIRYNAFVSRLSDFTMTKPPKLS